MPPPIIMIFAVALVIACLAGTLAARLYHDRRSAARRGDDEGVRRAGRTRDARGRVVKLIDPVPLYMLRRDDVIDRAALERIADELEPDIRSRRRLLLVGLLVGVLVFVMIGIMIAAEGAPAVSDLISTLTNPAILAAALGGAVAPWIAARQQRLRRVRNVMLRHQRCPHCGYGLTGVPANDDGTTTCPECACVWPRAADADGSPRPVARPMAPMLLALAGLTALATAGVIAFLIAR
jgi:hypothetical protein